MPRIGLAHYDLLLFPDELASDEDMPEGIVYIHGVPAVSAGGQKIDGGVADLLAEITKLQADKDISLLSPEEGLLNLSAVSDRCLGWYALLSEEVAPPGGIGLMMLGMYAVLGANSSREPEGQLEVLEIGAKSVMAFSPQFAAAITALLETLVYDARERHGRHANTLVVYSEAPSDDGRRAMGEIGFDEWDASLPGFKIAVPDLLHTADDLLRDGKAHPRQYLHDA